MGHFARGSDREPPLVVGGVAATLGSRRLKACLRSIAAPWA